MRKNSSFENFSTVHSDFLHSLEKFPDIPLPGLEMRGYQKSAILKVRNDILAGHKKGQLILGTGGGKTTIAKALIAGTNGRTLYLGPSSASVKQGEKEFKKRELSKSYQVLDESTPFSRFNPNVDVTYATAQMLMHDGRFARLNRGQFDMVIFDEAHHFLGRAFSELSTHFDAAQIFFTATPGNKRSHLNDLVPHQFFKYTSNDLIDNENFPPWRVFRHEVQNEHLETAVIIGDYMQLEGADVSILNLPHRFAICRDLFLESVSKGEKRISFMPSVASSKTFVDEIVSMYPSLKGKVVHVDGSVKNIAEIKQAFERGEILGICCKDLWTESLDVPDIAAITLADPSCSERVIIQRIGRGARPSPGKTFLRIDDVVSCISQMSYCNDRGIIKRPLTVHGILGLKRYTPGEAVNGKAIYKDDTKYETREVSFTERYLSQDTSFIRNPILGASLFMEFARIFRTSVMNLFMQPEVFFKNKKTVSVESHDGNSFQIDFEDAYKIAELFNCIERIESLVVDEILAGRKALADKVEHASKSVRSCIKNELDLESNEVNEKTPLFRKIKILRSLVLEDQELDYIWQKILGQCEFDLILYEKYHKLTDFDLCILSNAFGQILCIHYGWFSANKKGTMFATIRKLQEVLKKRGISIELNFNNAHVVIKKFDIGEIDDDLGLGREEKYPWSDLINSIRPNFITSEIISRNNPDKEVAAYDDKTCNRILDVVKLFLSKLKEDCDMEVIQSKRIVYFEILASKIDDEVVKKMIPVLDEVCNAVIRFRQVGKHYLFEMDMPDKEIMRMRSVGMAQFQILRSMQFHSLDQNIIWQKLLEEITPVFYFDFQLFEGFSEYISQNCYDVDVVINRANTILVQGMAKQLAQYGIDFQYHEAPDRKGQYYFTININEMKVSYLGC